MGRRDAHGATPLASPDTGLDDCYRIAVGDVGGAIGAGWLIFGTRSRSLLNFPCVLLGVARV